MNYRELLNKLIKESGLSNKEIVARCAKLGEKITPNYLSVLKNQNDKIPSDNLSIALAKACNAKYEDILLIQGYLDKTPKPILDVLEKTKEIAFNSTNSILEMAESSTPKQLLVDFRKKAEEEKNKMYLALFVCEFKQFEESFDISQFIKATPIPETKWALIPITDPNGIKILSKDEVESTLK